MIPILFEYNATTFTGKGLGEIVEAIECTVKAADDSSYELELLYPMTGKMLSDLKINRIIVAKPDYYHQNQAFRIYGYSKDIEGMLTVKAQHISYDLSQVLFHPYWSAYSDYQGRPVYGSFWSPGELLQALKNTNYLINGQHNFTFGDHYGYKAYPYQANVRVDEPTTARNVLFGSSNSLLSEFGGACVFDNYNLNFYSDPGYATSYVIDYGVDLIDLEQEENIANMYTGILPYYIGKDRSHEGESDWGGPQSVVIGNIAYASGTFQRHHILPLNVNDHFGDTDIIDMDIWGDVLPGDEWIPTKSVVTNVGKQIMKSSNSYGVPEVSLKVNSAYISNDVKLYDIITVRFVKFGINVRSRVNSITYDTLNEHVQEIELGKTRQGSFWDAWGDSEYHKRAY